MYVLTAYAAQQQTARDHFRRLARRDFRKHIIDALQDPYHVYQICFKLDDDMKDFVRRNYYQLAGQIFSFEGILIYAEECVSSISSEEARSKVHEIGGKLILRLENGEVELHKIIIGEPIIKYSQ